MHITPTNRRRWLPFKIRTMLACFITFSIAATWLGSELKLIHARYALLETGALGSPSIDWQLHPQGALPFYRRWLGDVTVPRIDLRNEEDFERAELLFPESSIWFIPRDYKLTRPVLQP